MNELPVQISPETAAWMQTQIALSNARTAALLRTEINKVDDWANGIYAALQDLLALQLPDSPALAQKLAQVWARPARDFDRIHVQGLPARPDEPLEFLEARKMLFCSPLVLGRSARPGAR